MTFDPVIVEKVARALRQISAGLQRLTIEWETTSEEDRDECSEDAATALTAICTAHPGIAAVLAGEAVCVPREPTEAMIDAPRWLFLGAFSPGQLKPGFALADLADAGGYSTAGLTSADLARAYLPTKAHRASMVYRAMLAASPYAPTLGRETSDAG